MLACDTDETRLKRLVHYVAWAAGKKDWFGAIKLNKVLWFADARNFVLTGKPITGAVYIREKYGPIAKHMLVVQAELEKEGKIKTITEGKLSVSSLWSHPMSLNLLQQRLI